MIKDGISQRQVAHTLGMSPSGVNRLCAQYLETGNNSRRPGQGRPRATADVQDRYLRNIALRNRHSMARGLRNDLQLVTGLRVSNQIVSNRLQGDLSHARRPATVPIVTVANRTDRHMFAQNQIE